MKLATVKLEDRTAVAIETATGKVAIMPGHYPDVDTLIQSPGEWRTDAAETLRSAPQYATEALNWLPPVVRPGKLLCVALNNSANPDRIMSGPQTPAMFVKPSSSLLGHRHPIIVKDSYGRVHPEPELAVVIGSRGADIPVESATDHIFGYTIINDITSPTMRSEDTFHYRAIHPAPGNPDGVRYVESWVSYPARYKGSDTFGPMGPWVVTSDDIPNPHALNVRCSHNGRVITDDTTANLRFSVAEVISFTSSYLTLDAGDVIAMGTALRPSAKGGAVQNVDLTLLGGTIEVAIERIGTLSNPVEHR